MAERRVRSVGTVGERKELSTTEFRDAALGIASHRLSLTGPRARRLYQWIVRRMERLGVPPHIVTLDAPGFWGAKYKDFRRVRERVDAYDFGDFRSLRLTHKGLGWSGRDQWAWKSTAAVVADRHRDLQHDAYWLLVPEQVGLGYDEAIRHLTDFGRVCVDHYGYLYTMPLSWLPSVYPSGIAGHEPFATEDERENTGWWFLYGDALPPWLLRDVYPVNFLSAEHLALDVGGVSLRRWIEAEPDERGTLEPLSKKIAMWRVPIDVMPAVRESLFRAGLLFYFRFVQHWEPDNPWKRDFAQPFRPPRRIPEIFRADYRRITDRWPGPLATCDRA